jgi:hypothetical protein
VEVEVSCKIKGKREVRARGSDESASTPTTIFEFSGM